MKTRTVLAVSVALAWIVTGLLYQKLPCPENVSLLSEACFPASMEVLVVFVLLACVPWATLRSGSRHLAAARSGQASRLRSYLRFVYGALITIGAVFIAGSFAVMVSQALSWGPFAGEGGMRVMIVAMLASFWSLGAMAVMAILLSTRHQPPECTGTDTQTGVEAAPRKDSTE